ncbi:MAG: lytic transglycosylase domain-containing protein, partial [Syntrophales bacterium]
VSPVGARGLMPATAASLQVADSFHPESNIDGGVRYLRYLSNLFKGNLPLVLAAYNAGENAVIRYNNSIPPYKETRTYVKRVLHYLEQYRNEKN